jgi:hypothetical protein
MEKTIQIQLKELREEIAQDIETILGCSDAAAIARGAQ